MHNHAKKTLGRLAVVTLALAPACTPMKPPVQNSGEVQSNAGVAYAVMTQSCSQSTEYEAPSWTLLEERLAVVVRNGSPEAITVHRDRFRLRLPDGSLLETKTWGAADPITVASGQSRTIKLRFMVNSDLTCRTAMELDAGRAFALGEHDVALGAVWFVPRRSL